MKKYTVSLLALLLFVAGLVMHYLVSHSENVDTDLIGFFSGFCSGAGLSIFIYSIVYQIRNHKKGTGEE